MDRSPQSSVKSSSTSAGSLSPAAKAVLGKFPPDFHSSADFAPPSNVKPFSVKRFQSRLNVLKNSDIPTDFYQSLRSLSDLVRDEIDGALVTDLLDHKLAGNWRIVVYYCGLHYAKKMVEYVAEFLDDLRHKHPPAFHGSETDSDLCRYIECIIILVRVSIAFLNIIIDEYSDFDTKQKSILKLQLRGELLVHKNCLVRRFLTRKTIRDNYQEKIESLLVKEEIFELLKLPNRIQDTYPNSPDSTALWKKLKDPNSRKQVLTDITAFDRCIICIDDIDESVDIAIMPCKHLLCIPCIERLACHDDNDKWSCSSCRNKNLSWTSKWTFQKFLERDFLPIDEPQAQTCDANVKLACGNLQKYAVHSETTARNDDTAVVSLWSSREENDGLQKWLKDEETTAFSLADLGD